MKKADKKELRKLVKEILISLNYAPYSPYSPLDWLFFDEYGKRILQKVSFKGNYTNILKDVRKSFEDEGWELPERYGHL